MWLLDVLPVSPDSLVDIAHVVWAVMASGRVRTGIRPGTDRHLSIPRSGRSGFGDIRSIPRLPHRSVPKSSRSMSVLDHGRSVGSVQLGPNIREISVGYESQSGPTG